MSAQMMVRAWELPDLTPAERLVLLALADCADRFGRNAFKSESSIADHTQLSLRTVKRAIQSLKIAEHIVVQELPTGRRSTTYQLFPEYCARLEAAEADGAGRGDNVTPPRGRARGDNASPLRGQMRGDNVSPVETVAVTLGVTSGVTSGVTFRDPYKDDPVDPVDPVDPALVALLAKFGLSEFRIEKPTPDRFTVFETIRMAARGRGLTRSRRVIEAAVDAAYAAAAERLAISEKSA